MFMKIVTFLCRTFPLWHKFSLWLLKAFIFPWLKELVKKTDNNLDNKAVEAVERVIIELDPTYKVIDKDQYQAVVEDVADDIKAVGDYVEDKVNAKDETIVDKKFKTK